MDAKTTKALEASIEKWETNAQVPALEEAKIAPRDCPLCDIYWDIDCDGCPVARRTGCRGCTGSPYSAAAKAFAANDLPGLHSASRREVEFLTSLLQENPDAH